MTHTQCHETHTGGAWMNKPHCELCGAPWPCAAVREAKHES